MFEIVDAPFPKDDNHFLEENWFLKHSVTSAQQDEFKKWMIDFVLENKEARTDLLNVSKNKKLIEKSVDSFIFSYFWTCEVDTDYSIDK